MSKTFEDSNLNILRENFKYMVKESFEEFFADKEIFDIKRNYRSYYFDEVELQTNTFRNVINTLYVEIKQPLNYKDNSRGLIPELYLTLEEIKNGIFSILITKNDKNTLLWQTKFGIELSYNNTDEELEKSNDKENICKDNINIYRFKLIIGLSYKNKRNKYGILYYANNKGDAQLEYPIIAIENFVYKNYQTKNMYTKYINIFKNMFMESKKVDDVPPEIFETILYNVPNNLFNEKINFDTVKNILNYLRNFSIKEYKTIDEQDSAFVSQYRAMSLFFVKHALKYIEKFYNQSQI